MLTSKKEIRKRDHGEGSIRYIETKDLWEIRLSFGRLGDGTHDRRSKYAKTEAEAKKILKQMKKERDAQINVDAQKTTMKEYFDEFLENERNKIKENSLIRKREIIETYITPEIGYICIGDLTFKDCRNVIEKVIDAGLSHSTVKKVFEALNACLRWAADVKRDILYNPMTGLAKPAKDNERIKPEEEMNPFTLEECKLIYNEANRKYGSGRPVYRLGWLIILILSTGMRGGEALAISWKDVDTEARTLHIRKTTTIGETKSSTKDARKYTTIISKRTKTHAGNRIIKLNDTAFKSLMELKKITGNYENVATTQTGKLVSYRNFSRTFHDILRAVNISERGIHQLRHTFASQLFAKKIPVKIISELLGHKSVQTTIDKYIHIFDEQMKEAMCATDFLGSDDESKVEGAA